MGRGNPARESSRNKPLPFVARLLDGTLIEYFRQATAITADADPTGTAPPRDRRGYLGEPRREYGTFGVSLNACFVSDKEMQWGGARKDFGCQWKAMPPHLRRIYTRL